VKDLYSCFRNRQNSIFHWNKWSPYHTEILSAVPKENGGYKCVKIFIKILNEDFNKYTVVMKSTIWHVMKYSPDAFEECDHQGWSVSKTSKKPVLGSGKQSNGWTSTELHDIISHKIVFSIVNATRTSNLKRSVRVFLRKFKLTYFGLTIVPILHG
jgi:hypothetical protein